MTMAMTSRERVLCALNCGTPDVVPFAEQSVGFPIQQRLLGRADDADVSPRELAEAIGNDIVKFKRYPPLYYERVTLGDSTPGIGPGMIHSRDDLAQVVMPEDDVWIDDAREFLRTQRGERAAVGALRLGISGVLISMGLEHFSMALYDDAGLIEELLERYARFGERTARVMQELGFDLLWCFDDFAYGTGPMFSPDVLRTLFLPRLRRVTEQIKVPWIFHSDGDLFPVLDDLLSLGMSGLHPIEPEAMDLSEVKRALAGRCCVIGNIGVDLLTRGTPDEVREAVRRAFAIGAPGGGYMISSGNSIPGTADLDNVREMVDTIAELREEMAA